MLLDTPHLTVVSKPFFAFFIARYDYYKVSALVVVFLIMDALATKRV
jgi:hypothetical protein